jgi:hypothetical protein
MVQRLDRVTLRDALSAQYRRIDGAYKVEIDVEVTQTGHTDFASRRKTGAD